MTSTVTAGGASVGAGVASAHGRDRLGVIGVVVGERDPAESASALELGPERRDVLVERRARDRPARPGRAPRSTSSSRSA